MANINVTIRDIARFTREQGIALETGKKKEAPSRFRIVNWDNYTIAMGAMAPSPNIYGRKVTAILVNGQEVDRCDSKRLAVRKAAAYRKDGKVTYRTIYQVT
jgi:hypothetical protein